MALLFVCRALQVQARGSSSDGLAHLETALGLSRQVKNQSPLGFFMQGSTMEYRVLAGLDNWLRHTGPDKKLLRKALDILQRHEAAIPEIAGSIKAEYLVLRNSESAIGGKMRRRRLQTAAFHVPWEKQRQDRITRAAFYGQLRLVQKPSWQIPTWTELRNQGNDNYTQLARVQGLPPEDGPGSNLSARQWGRFLYQSYAPGSFVSGELTKRPDLRAAQVVTAVLLYQAEKGKLPDKLDDLVPDYFAELPIDPSNGKHFRYRISKGEVTKGGFPNEHIELVPGQALVWSEGYREYKFPVPVWKK
jgi:hypothetical protein